MNAYTSSWVVPREICLSKGTYCLIVSSTQQNAYWRKAKNLESEISEVSEVRERSVRIQSVEKTSPRARHRLSPRPPLYWAVANAGHRIVEQSHSSCRGHHAMSCHPPTMLDMPHSQLALEHCGTYRIKESGKALSTCWAVR